MRRRVGWTEPGAPYHPGVQWLPSGRMEYRTLGRTGVKVSPLCLGRHDVRRLGQPPTTTRRPHHPPGARRRDQLHRHRRCLLLRRVRGDRRQGPGADGRRRRSCWPPRSMAPWARTPTREATRGAGSWPSARTACAAWAPTTSTCTRSTGRPRHRHRRDAGRADRPGADRARSATSAARPFPPMRSSRPSGWRERRGRGAVRHRAAALLDPGPRHREATCCRCARSTAWGCCPWSPLAGGWLSGAFGAGKENTSRRSGHGARPLRHDAAR